MNIEFIVETEDSEVSIGISTKNYVPRIGETIWMLPYNWERKKEFGTRAFLVENVCHHISTKLENYDSLVVYVSPIVADSE